jgi:DNA-binding beta-propeller fold protein YncE
MNRITGVAAWMAAAGTLCGATVAHAAVYGVDIDAGILQYGQSYSGALHPLSPPSLSTPSHYAEGTAVSPDGRSAYIAEQSNGSGSSVIGQFNIMAGGALKPKSPATLPAAGSPTSIAMSPDGQSVYALDRDGEAVLQYDVGTNGRLSPKTPASVSVGSSCAPGGLAVSPDSRNVYVTSFTMGCGSNNGELFHLTADTGGRLTLRAADTLQAPGANGVVTSPDGKSLYAGGVSNGAPFGSGVVYQYNLTATGRPAPKSPASATGSFTVGSLVVDRTSHNLYAATNSTFCNDQGQQVSVFRYPIGQAGRLGAFTKYRVAGSKQGSGGLVLGGAGRSLFAAATDCGSFKGFIVQFNVAPSGALSQKSPFVVPSGSFLGGHEALAATPAGPACSLHAASRLAVRHSGTGRGRKATGGAFVLTGNCSQDVTGRLTGMLRIGTGKGKRQTFQLGPASVQLDAIRATKLRLTVPAGAFKLLRQGHHASARFRLTVHSVSGGTVARRGIGRVRF